MYTTGEGGQRIFKRDLEFFLEKKEEDPNAIIVLYFKKS